MKIGYIYDTIYPDTIGGVEKRIHEIGTRLASRGHEIHLYGMKYWEGPDIIHREGMILHGVFPAMELYTEDRRSILQALRYTYALTPHIFKAELDIVDCQNFPYFPVILVSLISRIKSLRLVVTWHEFWGRYWFTYLGKKGLLGLLIEMVALYLSPVSISVSNLTAEQIHSTGYKGEITIIPNGIDNATISQASSVQQISDLIFVGRFIPEKHPELVVDAVALLIQDYPDLRCIMVGDGPSYPAIKKRIQKTNLEKTITCTGFVAAYETVLGLMKSSKIFILPSEREGFGIAAIEAIACGLSVVTVDHPRNAASDHVLPGAGYLASMDPLDIAAGIRQCLQNRPDPAPLKQYALNHDWDQITRNIEQYYHTILTEKSRKYWPDRRIPVTIGDIFQRPDI